VKFTADKQNVIIYNRGQQNVARNLGKNEFRWDFTLQQTKERRGAQQQKS
jgi:hypothetical protein